MHVCAFLEASSTPLPSTDVQSDDDEDEENEDEFLPGFDVPLDLKPAEIGNPIEHFFSRIVTFNDKDPKIAIWTKNIWALLRFSTIVQCVYVALV